MRLRIRRSNVLGGIRQAVSGSYVPDAGVGAAVASSKVLDNGGSVAVCMSSVRLGHIPRDDKGIDKLSSHRYKTPVSAIATIENPNASMSQPVNHSQDVMRILPEPDVVSSDSTNSVREQLRQVNQRLDEVQRNFVRSKEEVGETTKGGSPFAPKILDKLIPSSF
ncbi:hypothetical protein B296_00006353 [Ensete ventricosum]|uniref:Uncharacterized protein n=1 Tax=Ensete ventricosum TaxID=4639 RepID=A0A427AJY6_ENSVE|nr:hypothetical protein B296_00006353 [Ensete ventricosum]